MALASIGQDDFGGGIYRGRKAPPNSVYDCVNGLIDDEGLIYKRGGSAYLSASSAGSDIAQVFAVYMRAVAETRVLANASKLYALDASDTPVDVGNPTDSRPASLGDYAIFATAGATTLTYYAGSLTHLSYTTGTVSVTLDSTTVTGSGTSWDGNVDAGMIFTAPLGSTSVVASVDSDTQITLTAPYQGATGTGLSYGLDPTSQQDNAMSLASGRAFVASAGQRLLWASGNRVYATDRNDPFAFDADRYIEVPSSVNIVGLEGRGDSALIFTTGGVYLASNLALDAVDAYGNVQWVLDQVNKDVILWDDYGIAGWAGGLVIPAVDDMFLMSAGFDLAPITGSIRPLYRDYVKSGYQLGTAAAYRGHCLLPVVESDGDLVDVLVCRLDRGAAFTRWSGHAAGVAFATLVEESSREPKLLGASGEDVTDLTDCFDPAAANASDADSTDPSCTIVTRDFPTGNNQPGTVARIRARYILEDDGSSSPTVTPAFSSDEDDDTFTNLTDKGEQGGGTGWAESDGSTYNWATVGKKRERIRFKLTQAGAAGSFILRSLEVLLRPSGKQ